MSESYLDSGVVFPPFKTHYTVLGVRAAAWPRILAVLAVGVVAFLLLGALTVEAQEQTNASERASAKHELVQMRDAVKEVSSASAAAGTEELAKLDGPEETKRLAAQGESKGIKATTTDNQIAEMVPAEKTVEKEAIDPVMRLFLLVVLPTLATLMWHMEFPPGWSLDSEAKRIRKFSKRQRFAVSRKRTWLHGDGED